MNALRLAFGTLTALPVPPPRRVDRAVAGWAMALAPIAGAVLALPLWAVTSALEDTWSASLLAVLWIAGLAALTRGIHLDGLADTADGLGSGQPPAVALEIMRRSDVGPFGVATLTLMLLVQAAAAAELLAAPAGAAALATATVSSRFVLPWICRRGVTSAREDGLGAGVAGSVSGLQLLVSTMTAVLLLVAIAAAAPGPDSLIAVGAIGFLGGVAFHRWCALRLGGVTGDVMGACVEVSFACSLLAMTLS